MRIAGNPVQVRVARHLQQRHVLDIGGIGYTRVDAATVGEAVVLALGGQAQVALLAQLEAGVGRGVRRLAAAVGVAAPADVAADALVVRFQDDVDHARNRIGAVLRGGAVRQHLDVVDHRHRNVAQVGRGAALVWSAQHGQVGGAVAALAVHQHQGVVGAQAAQARRQRQVGGIAAEGLRREGRQVLRQCLDQVGLAGTLQSPRIQHLHRRRAVFHLQAVGAGTRDGAGHDGVGRSSRRLTIGGGLRRFARTGHAHARMQQHDGCRASLQFALLMHRVFPFL